jgi:predicted transcriptional regulator of viral defense system
MKKITLEITNAGYADRLLTDRQLARIVGGSAQRRYGLVNRALKANEMIRLQRGLYMLASKYRRQACHPFHLAQNLVPGSYVSFETALAFHGWIPEAVYVTASLVPGRKSRDYEHEQMGQFTFHPLAIDKRHFLELVERVQINQQTMLVAKPIRALMDLVCLRKMQWRGVEWIEKGMRIEQEYLDTVTAADLQTLKLVYKQQRVQKFLEELEQQLGLGSYE